jgi:hypothetical protein
MSPAGIAPFAAAVGGPPTIPPPPQFCCCSWWMSTPINATINTPTSTSTSAAPKSRRPALRAITVSTARAPA